MNVFDPPPIAPGSVGENEVSSVVGEGVGNPQASYGFPHP